MTRNTSNTSRLNWGYIAPIIAVGGLSGILFGFDQGIWNVVSKFLLANFNIDPSSAAGAREEGFAVSILYLGSLVGAILSGYSTNRLGRKKSLLIAGTSFFVGISLYALAPTLTWVVIGRIIMGLAIGIAAMASPLYLAEVSPPQIRGAAVSSFQLSITLGIVLTSLVGVFLEQSGNWRLMVGLGLVPTIVLILGLFFTPCSPRWLVTRGRSPEATDILQKLLNKRDVSAEVDEIQANLRNSPTANISQLFTKRLFPLVVVSFGLFVFQQLSGVNVFFTYSTSIFAKAGLGQSASYLSTFGLGVVNVLATLLSMSIVDKVGRRSLLLLGFAGAAVCLALLGLLLNSGNTSYLLIVACFVYVVFFALGLGPTPYLIMSEIFPLSVRGTAMAFSSCANWVLNGLVVGFFPFLTVALGTGNSFYLFAALSGVAFFFVLALVPETKGVSLEQIEANLYSGKTVRHLGDVVPSSSSVAFPH